MCLWRGGDQPTYYDLTAPGNRSAPGEDAVGVQPDQNRRYSIREESEHIAHNRPPHEAFSPSEACIRKEGQGGEEGHQRVYDPEQLVPLQVLLRRDFLRIERPHDGNAA